ncbi:MAG: FAD synthase [Methanomassiliicoccaceae archaeon]|nr:FAD synthase [Methanomassiliicoccaceae archaeon]
MASGVFDIIHTGHISYLQQARALGDELVAVVACDDTVRRSKHEPVTPEGMRLKIVACLKPVDAAILGKVGDMLDTVAEVAPDIIVLGFDQGFDEGDLARRLAERGMGHIKVTRAAESAEDLAATRRIIQRIRDLEGRE